MEFTFTLTLQDILAFVGVIAVLFVTYYIVSMLKRLIEVLDNINQVIEKNKTNIDNTLEVLPKLVDNVNKIAANIESKGDEVAGIVTSVNEVAASVDDIVSTFSDIVALVSQFKGMFSKKKFKIKR